MNIVAVTRDLMDRSKISAVFDEVRVVRTAEDLGEPDVVIVDLQIVGAIEAAVATGARVVAYGSHVDDEVLAAASRLGAEAMPRSRFFRRLGSGTLLS